MKILVTGGAGYIGSHTCIELLGAGHEICIVDDLSNSNIEVIKRIKIISNKEFIFFETDIRNSKDLGIVFSKFKPDAVIHFAGLKSVEESVSSPLIYYNVNVSGSIALLEQMDLHNCKKIVFSSSATVYGKACYLPFDEHHPTGPVNPYGRTKLLVEEMLSDWIKNDNGKYAISLRYFNPVGAHKSKLIGEDPSGKPNNLMPFIAQVAIGKRKILRIFGNDYDTKDGTGVRDFVHVMDLASAHVKAIEKQTQLDQFEIINLGSGNGSSVLDLLKSFETVSGKSIPFKIVDRRKGDISASWTNPAKALIKLDWQTTYSLETMCNDTWEWQFNNPNGFE